MDTKVCNEMYFYSEALGRRTTIRVFIPRMTLKQIREKKDLKYPCLYLLHGVMGDYTDWSRFSNIERYAGQKGLAIVMPSGENGWYNDVPNGDRLFTYISRELTQLIPSLFPVSEKREDTFVAGLSMGGYGAYKMALTYPEVFGAAASLSGSLDLSTRMDHKGNMENGEFYDMNEVLFNDFKTDPTAQKGTKNDLFYLMSELKNKGSDIPKLYACCGTEDGVKSANDRLKAYAQELGVDMTYEFGPGIHDWIFWEEWIQRVLNWLPLKGTEIK